MIKTSELIWQDTQHAKLFELLDELAKEPFDPKIIYQLRLYADHHFCLEEAYMAELKYPDRQAHVVAHNRFRKELSALAVDAEQLNHGVREALSSFLSEWLKRHIYGVDKDFEKFVLASERK